MFSSYCTLHSTSHNTLVDMMDAWARPGTMWAHFDFSGMSSMSRLHVCVDLSLDPSGRLMEIGFLAGCRFFTGVPCKTKCSVAPESITTSCLVICMIDVEYYVSICLFIRLLIIIVLLSSTKMELDERVGGGRI